MRFLIKTYKAYLKFDKPTLYDPEGRMSGPWYRFDIFWNCLRYCREQKPLRLEALRRSKESMEITRILMSYDN